MNNERYKIAFFGEEGTTVYVSSYFIKITYFVSLRPMLEIFGTLFHQEDL